MAEAETIIYVQMKANWGESQELIAELKVEKRDIKSHALQLLRLSILRQCAIVFKCRKPCFCNIIQKLSGFYVQSFFLSNYVLLIV